MRTQTLVKGCIVQVDAAPFKQWYQQHYGVEVGQKKRAAAAAAAPAEGEAAAAQSNHVKRKLKQRNQGRKLDQLLDDQFATGRLYAAIASRPGQVRRRGGVEKGGRRGAGRGQRRILRILSKLGLRGSIWVKCTVEGAGNVAIYCRGSQLPRRQRRRRRLLPSSPHPRP